MPTGAMFDVKPVRESGGVDVEKISAVQPVINLAAHRPKKEIKKQTFGAPYQQPAQIRRTRPSKSEFETVREPKLEPAPDTEEHNEIPAAIHSVLPAEPALPPVIGIPSHAEIKEQFEELLNHDLDLGVELARMGVRPRGNTQAKPRYRVIQSSAPAAAPQKAEPDQYASLLSDIHHSATVIAREEYLDPDVVVEPTLASALLETPSHTEEQVRSFYADSTAQLIVRTSPSRPKGFMHKPAKPVKQKKRRVIPSKYFFIAAAIIACLIILIGYGLHLKNKIIEQSAAAVTNIQTAQADLKSLDFNDASKDFFAAYANFANAGSSINVFGATITNFISSLPGAGTLKSAKNLVQVGQLLSGAGTSMTTALNAVSKTGAMSDPANPQIPIGPIVSALKKALIASQQQVAQASTLMADIDSSIIPPDKQAGFEDLKAKLPELKTFVDMGSDYAKFFENLINVSGYHRYLVMFQNGSELRPTGGFPGTYGVVSFKDGKLDMINVDDVYNLDGQLKEHVIPPLQMQHITPTWGMRDANWYVDFPVSARNIEAFYQKESGQTVDGVIIINPEMIQKILEIVGPVAMPAYNLTLDSTNVLTTLQAQVEYGANRTQPKQIVKDFMPLLMSKIYAAGSDKWLAIFNTVILSMNQKNVLMNFKNISLESFVTDKGFGGQVHQGDVDYVMPVITNIKGSKTDAVTDTSFALDTSFDGATAIHTLTITRQHNGGGTKFGFYNKQNPAYVRILVPEGAQLVSVTGNDQPNFQPLINYGKDKSFVKDDTLVKFETSGTVNALPGVTTYKESGKTEFGFWLITDAGKSKTVSVQYRVPNALTGKTYQLYVQKQPALKVKAFDLTMEKPVNLTPEASYPLLTQKDSIYSYTGVLENDVIMKVNFK
jgi:hypothetical protein